MNNLSLQNFLININFKLLIYILNTYIQYLYTFIQYKRNILTNIYLLTNIKIVKVYKIIMYYISIKQ